MDKVHITFALSTELAVELDKCARSMGMSRSAFLEWLLGNALPLVPSMAGLMQNVMRLGLKAQKKRKLKGK